MIWTLVVFVILGLFLLSGIRIVRPTHRALIETLGKFSRIQEQGFTWIFPIIQSSRYVNITEQMVDVRPQTVITQDKLNAIVDAVVYYKVKDVKASEYNVDDHQIQLTSLARTTLRAVIGKMTLTKANENRDEINVKVEAILNKETRSYGVDVLRVEIQKIEPPKDVQDAMNEVVKAEQLKIASEDQALAREIEADGFKKAEIKKAEGDKMATVLRAEGKAKGFKLVAQEFKGGAKELEQLRVTENALKQNSKIVLPESKSLVNVLGNLSGQ